MGSTNSIDYENEIDKLRKENNLKIVYLLIRFNLICGFKLSSILF